jgi:hypothetical protein
MAKLTRPVPEEESVAESLPMKRVKGLKNRSVKLLLRKDTRSVEFK